MGGAALADVLFGKVSPAGRTTQTWYASDAEMPEPGLMEMRPAAAHGRGAPSPGWTYRYYAKQPAIPFGFGLSYTQFGYSNLTLNVSMAADPCQPVGAEVTVTNTGAVDSDEVVQLYIKQTNAPTAPRVRLVDFARVHIKAGQAATVPLSFSPKEQALVVGDTGVYQPRMVVPAGRVEVHAGGGQPDFYSGSVMAAFEVSAQAQLNRAYVCAR